MGRFSILNEFISLIDQKKFAITNVYDPRDNNSCCTFFEEIKEINAQIIGSQILLGDFNVTRHHLERSGEQDYSGVFHEFNSLINSLALLEISLRSYKFSWLNFKEKPSLIKLDRYLVLLEWHHNFPCFYLKSLARIISNSNYYQKFGSTLIPN